MGGNNAFHKDESALMEQWQIMPLKQTGKSVLTNPMRQTSKIDLVSNSSPVTTSCEGAIGYTLPHGA